jgi:hypothetical protein
MSVSKTIIHRTEVKNGEGRLKLLALSKKRQDNGATGGGGVSSNPQTNCEATHIPCSYSKGKKKVVPVLY